MAYDPTVWKSGDTITSAKLNKLENGLAEASGGTGGGVLVANVTFGEGTATLDKTWQQIHDGLLTGIVTAVINIEESMEVTCYYVMNCSYDTETTKYLVSLSVEDFPMFSADSSSDYPIAQLG